MATNYLAEAFQQMKLLESETFSFDNDGAAKLSNFMDDDLLTDVEVVIDPEAETEEDLKDSYIGDIILACEVCHSMIYKREEEVTVEEDADMANVGELCPYCYSSDGFKIIGKVAPYEEITVETESGEDVKVEVDGKKIETEADDEDEIKDLDPETEEDREELDESLNEAKDRKEKGYGDDVTIGLNKDGELDIVKDENQDNIEDLTENKDGKEKGTGDDVILVLNKKGQLEIGKDENQDNIEPLEEEAKEPLSVRLKKRLAMKAENLEEEVIEENFYAVVEVDGEERRFPFKDRDAARRYIQYVRNGAPEFEGKKIGSMWTESLDSEGKPLKEDIEYTQDNKEYSLEDKIKLLGSHKTYKGYTVDVTANTLLRDGEPVPFKGNVKDFESVIAYIDSLKEAMEDISITTETDVIKVKSTPREDKEAIVPMQPEEVEEIVEPAAEEVEEIPEEEFVEEPAVDEEAVDTDVDIEEFDEEGFDELGESYLKKVYENVESYKTTSGSLKNNSICLEGVITFNSGKKAKTSFIFEAKEMTKRGKLKFIGENVNLSKNKKAFTLTGIADNKKLMCESLTYNYLAKDAKNNKAKKLYGTVKR